MLIALLLICAIALLVVLRRGQVSDLRRYGVSRRMQQAARSVEPDMEAPEPEEFESC